MYCYTKVHHWFFEASKHTAIPRHMIGILRHQSILLYQGTLLDLMTTVGFVINCLAELNRLMIR